MSNNINNDNVINDFKDIKLDYHTIIEASAGAGKTYFLENIVTRILLEKKFPASKLVVVTFTEKATAELQERVRVNLEKILQEKDGEKKKLVQKALEEFSQINISTIHGFCNKILSEYAFDSGMLFETNLLTDTQDIRLKLLHSIMKKDWYEEYGDDLVWLIQNIEVNFKGNYEDVILNALKNYNPLANIQLIPDPNTDLKKLIKKIKRSVSNPFELVNDEKLKKSLKLENDLYLAAILLMTKTVKKLKTKIDEYKVSKGIISYDDMINIVAKAVKENTRLRQLLQNEFQYALVDEFQDTDALQFEIFRQIFLEGKGNKLFVIGDPKQSIYGFRNADIHSYFYAKKIIKEKYSGKSYTLAKNWRSTKKLIDDFNKLFNGWEWEEHSFKDIDYSDNSENRKIIFPADDFRKNVGIHFFLIPLQNKATRQTNYIKAITKEINYLLKNDIKIVREDSTEERLNLNHICILVRSREDALMVEKKLHEANLKASIYKKSNLYQTEEALNCKYLLHALAHSDNLSSLKQALLTEFFNIDITRLADFLESEEFNKITAMMERWRELAHNNLWGKFFHFITEDTGFLYRIAIDTNIGYERKITNYKHIFEVLETIASSYKFNIIDLAEYMNDLVSGRANLQAEEDLHRLETEEPHITISTIHASKGLEFPIVFLFSFESSVRINKTDTIKYYDKEEHKIFLDLLHKESANNLAKQEKFEEDKRLFYVGVTRAIYKLYLPYYLKGPTTSNRLKLGPVAIKVNEKIKSIFVNNYEYIIENDFLEELINVIKNNNPVIKKKKVTDYSFDKHINQLDAKYDKTILERKKITVTSFSGLHYIIQDENSDNIYSVNFGDNKKDQDEVETENILSALSSTESILPGGTQTGSLLHNILEVINFEEISMIKDYTKIKFNEEIEKKIRIFFNEKKIIDSKEQNKLRSRLKQIILNVLHTPIMEDFSLCYLREQDRLHEVEFYMTLEEKNDNNLFLMGFIDMVFIKDGKYYFVDWKSNILDYYHGEEFEKSVVSHYKLQYQIYAIAFAKWLESYNIPIDQFEGFYYLYLRGMDAQNSHNGVFFVKVTKELLQEYKNEILDIIKKASNE